MTNKGPRTRSKVNCYRCRSFFITYESGKPYGCRAMNFKSRDLPSQVVYMNSGLECQLYTPKPQKEGEEKS